MCLNYDPFMTGSVKSILHVHKQITVYKYMHVDHQDRIISAIRNRMIPVRRGAIISDRLSTDITYQESESCEISHGTHFYFQPRQDDELAIEMPMILKKAHFVACDNQKKDGVATKLFLTPKAKQMIKIGYPGLKAVAKFANELMAFLDVKGNVIETDHGLLTDISFDGCGVVFHTTDDTIFWDEEPSTLINKKSSIWSLHEQMGRFKFFAKKPVKGPVLGQGRS